MSVLFFIAAVHAAPLTMSTTEHRLENGLRVIVHEDHRVPLFAAELRYHVGAAEDSTGGMAHLVEHLMFEGSQSAPDGAYDRWLAAAGASNNAWTSHDETTFSVVGPANALALTLFLESDRMGWMTLEEEDVLNQFAVIANERDLSRGAVGGWDATAISLALYPWQHPYHHTVLGEDDDVSSLTIEDIQSFLARWYHPANATLVVVGDVNAETVFALAAQYFSELPSAVAPPRSQAMAPRLQQGKFRVLYEETQPTLTVVWPTVPMGHPDEPALDILSAVLAHRLQQSGITASAWTDNRRLSGRFVVRLSRRRGALQPLLRTLDRELRQMARRLVVPADLQRVTTVWRADRARRMSDVEQRARMLADCAVRRGQPDCVEHTVQAWEAVTPQDLLSVAGRYLGEGRVLLSHVPWRKRRWALRGSEEAL